jgi:hypothetical protein
MICHSRSAINPAPQGVIKTTKVEVIPPLTANAVESTNSLVVESLVEWCLVRTVLPFKWQAARQPPYRNSVYSAWQQLRLQCCLLVAGSHVEFGMSSSLVLKPEWAPLWVALPPPAPHLDEAIW